VPKKAHGIGGKILVRPLLYLSRSNGRGMCVVIEAFGFFLAPSTDMIAAPASAAKGAGHAHASRGKPVGDSDFAQFLASTANPAAAPQDDGVQDSKAQARPSSAAPSQDNAAKQDD